MQYCYVILSAIILFTAVQYFSAIQAHKKAGSKTIFSNPLDVEDASLTYFEILEPPSLRYMYKSKPAKNFGVLFNQSYSSVELFLGEPLNGCNKSLNPEVIRGNSVMFVRGDCSFVTKAITAQDAGALFVVIADNDSGSNTIRIEMVHDDSNRPVLIPALLLAGKDGAMIHRELKKSPHYNFALVNIPINLTTIPYSKRVHPPWTVL